MSTSWHRRRMLAMDFESDGTDPLTARIVQAAAVDIVPVDRGEASGPAYEVDRWSTLVWPGDDFEMAPGAEAVHHITTEQCRDHGIPTAQAVAHMTSKLHEVWAAGGVAVGHNLGGYDITLLAAETRRLGLPPFEVRGAIVDTLTLERCDLLHPKHKYRKGKRRLVDIVGHWGVTLSPDAAHDATEDSLAAARVAWRIAQLHPAIADMPVDQLMTYQAEQHAIWAADFEKWLRQKKADDDAPQEEIDAVSISRDWPLRRDLLPPAQGRAA